MKSPPSLYSAITGDSKLLAVLGKSGQLVRLFWPHIDYGQHVEEYRVAVEVSGKHQPLWLDSDDWEHQQRYEDGTNIVETLSANKQAKITVETAAFAPSPGDSLVLSYQIHNRAKSARSVRLFLYERFRINESPYYTTAFFDEDSGALLFYFRDACIATLGSQPLAGFQCNTHGDKRGAVKAIEHGPLSGRKIEHKLPEAAMAWNVGETPGKGTSRLTLVLSCGASAHEAIKKAKSVVESDIDSVRAETKSRDWRWLGVQRSDDAAAINHPGGIGDDVKQPEGEDSASSKHRAKEKLGLVADASRTDWRLAELSNLCGSQSVEVFLRSLLAIKLLSDRETGAIIAAPEFDREREQCGGYGYAWGRDGAFNAYALDLAGMHSEAEAFYQYAKLVQEPSGVWLHRHYATGDFAPSWGLIQIDETGAILWGIAEHYSFTKNRKFLRSMWYCVSQAASYLCGAIDEETGLPKPSFELWEENCCESVYAAAAVAGGLEAAVKCADVLEHEATSSEWKAVADRIRRAIPEKLWNKKRKVFSRSVKRIVSEEIFAKHARDKSRDYYLEAPEQSLYPTFYHAVDTTIDSSLLGLVFPFRILDPHDDNISLSAKAVRKHLWCKKTGGLLRYEGDVYVGGNPWILTTLWLAIYCIEAGDRERAIELIRWAAGHATQTGLLTEQVDKKTGKPIWAVPLGWSHAMFIIACMMLTAGEDSPS